MRFSWEQLEVFVAAVRCGSFSGAARELGKAQSAVSTAIANLELDLGIALFDRSGHTPRLTPEGEALLRDAEGLLRRATRFEGRALALATGVEPRLVLAVDELAWSPRVVALLARFAEAWPEVELEFLYGIVGDIANMVREGRAVMGLMVPLAAPEAGGDPVAFAAGDGSRNRSALSCRGARHALPGAISELGGHEASGAHDASGTVGATGVAGGVSLSDAVDQSCGRGKAGRSGPSRMRGAQGRGEQYGSTNMTGVQYLLAGDVPAVAVAAASHPLAARRTLGPEALEGWRQLDITSRGGERPVPRARSVWRLDSYMAIRDLVRAGLGWAYLPEELAAPDIKAGLLVRLPVEANGSTWRWPLYLVWRDGWEPGPAGRWLLERLGRNGGEEREILGR